MHSSDVFDLRLDHGAETERVKRIAAVKVLNSYESCATYVQLLCGDRKHLETRQNGRFVGS